MWTNSFFLPSKKWLFPIKSREKWKSKKTASNEENDQRFIYRKAFSMYQFPWLQVIEKRGRGETCEAPTAGTRDQTKDSKLRATFRPLAKQSRKMRQLSWWSKAKWNLSPGNRQIIPSERVFLVDVFCWVELIIARVYFLNVPFSVVIDKKSTDGPIRNWSLPVMNMMEPTSLEELNQG